ncbi:hypothetical protein C8R45DRAFT_1148137 [Mycena sanguinolenta]|nr:hypothetical protein C8R45DRAFT_1148137 [Mycena sanguinolenta]
MPQPESAHILALPPEVASEIFLRCVPASAPEEMRLQNGWPDPANCGPHLLAKVCRLWRDLVFSIPTLFTTFAASWHGSVSHRLPLTISTHIPHVSFASNTTPAHFIVSHAAPRIHFLQLRMPMQLFKSLADNIITLSFPLLRELDLHVIYSADHDSCVTFFHNVPQLQHVSRGVDGDLPSALEILELASQLLEITRLSGPGYDTPPSPSFKSLFSLTKGLAGAILRRMSLLCLYCLLFDASISMAATVSTSTHSSLALRLRYKNYLSVLILSTVETGRKLSARLVHAGIAAHSSRWLVAEGVLHVPRLKEVVFRASADHDQALINSLRDWWQRETFSEGDSPIFKLVANWDLALGICRLLGQALSIRRLVDEYASDAVV